jgi:putative two-component system response regulator
MHAKQPELDEHSGRVAHLAACVARHLGLDGESLDEVTRAAELHDVGKLGIPDSVLRKHSALDDAEWTLMRTHPELGLNLLDRAGQSSRETLAVLYHHERLDGSGYPDGLAGEAIPLEARIIAVADVYDALTSARAYREAWPPARALALIDAESGTKLDPRCVAALHRVLRDRPVAERADEAPRPSTYLPAHSRAAD